MATVDETAGRAVPRSSEWSPARLYLVISGIGLVLIAGLGFLYDRSFPASADEVPSAGSGYIFGILETNGWHNLNGVISGVIALGFALRPEWARVGALFKGTLYVVVTSAIAIWGPETLLIASNTADQIAHASLAVGGIATGLLTPSSKSSRR
jgi:Domain of unknown function (DUF4383)